MNGLAYDNNYYAWDHNAIDKGITPVLPSTLELEAVGAGLALLTQNIDIVNWTTCLVHQWSPETRALDLPGVVFRHLSTGAGSIEMVLTFSDRSTSRNSGATAWAWTYRSGQTTSDGRVGFIIPITHSYWTGRDGIVTRWSRGGPEAICAAIQCAAILLHELIHIVADGHSGCRAKVGGWRGPGTEADWSDALGALHEADHEDGGPLHPCWDEARMIATMFRYWMAQRYACVDAVPNCHRMDEPVFFGLSTGTQDQAKGLYDDGY